MGISRDFVRGGIPGYSTYLPLPKSKRNPPLGYGHSSVFEQTTPMTLSLVRSIRLYFQPSRHKLNSKVFRLIP